MSLNMKKLALLMALMLFTYSYGQDTPQDKEKKGPAFARISPEKKFESDLKRNSFTIYTVGGLKPTHYKTDMAFQKKYTITYHDFGCLAPKTMDFYEQYNLLVFQHLSEKWGEEWKKDIKDNAIGFNKWTKLD